MFSFSVYKLCLPEQIWLLTRPFFLASSLSPLAVGNNCSSYCSQTAKDHNFEGQSCLLVVVVSGGETLA